MSPSLINNIDTNDSDNFACYICYELAQDPIVTLCGHLFCWPCLYKWLHVHSHSYECPVCKASVGEEKVVPLYGRGRKYSGPTSKSIDGVKIPNRPSSRRPETISNTVRNNNFTGHHPSSRLMGGLGGFATTPSARFGNLLL